MKKVFFVSTGRCGTRRLAEILQKYLPATEFSVEHQTCISRLANIIGNISYYFEDFQNIKQRIYKHIIKKYARDSHFISIDPLLSMIIPEEVIKDKNLYIIHIVRDKEKFSRSFFRFTRKRILSFIAHNFVPLWQLGIYPLENIFNKNIVQKYQKLWLRKNIWLEDKYKINKNYKKIRMESLFTSNLISKLIKDIFNYQIEISKQDLKIRSNQT